MHCKVTLCRFGLLVFCDVVRPRIITRPEPPARSIPLPDMDVTGYAGHTVKIVEGRRLTLDVEATGRPTPKLEWRLPNGRRLGTGQSGGRVSVLANHSLVVSNVRVKDSGKYRPIASNPAGLSKVKTTVTVVGGD